MPNVVRRALAVVVAMVALADQGEGQLRLAAVDIRVPVPPRALPADGRVLLVYELRITNVGRADRSVTGIAVTADGQPVADISGEALRGVLARVGGEPAGDNRVLPGGRQAIAYLAVEVASDRIPPALSHRLLLTHPDSVAQPPRDTVPNYLVRVDRTPIPVIRSPLGGGPWLGANGPGNLSGHRRTAIPIDGQARIAQRFATDWVKFGDDGKLWRGDSTKNENWYGHGEPLHAVANGTVVATKDGIPENVPLAPQRAVPVTLETVGGNYVILDIGGGHFAFYAHLKPGSVAVKVGDRVRPGQVLGHLGNTGNSDAPHLHFHIGDSPTPLGGEGLPWAFERFDKLGMSSSLMAKWTAAGPPEPRRREATLMNFVVRF